MATKSKPDAADITDEEVDGMLRAAHDELESMLASGGRMRDAAHFRRLVRAREELEAAESAILAAVRDARAAGDSWAMIGAALDVSKQAAQQRFGKLVR